MAKVRALHKYAAKNQTQRKVLTEIVSLSCQGQNFGIVLHHIQDEIDAAITVQANVVE